MTATGVGAASRGEGTAGTASGADRRLDVQGLRGVAVLLVVLYHLDVGPRSGFLGVDVFFVISGFVIGRRLVDERWRTGTVRLRSFYARRARRLLPAMAVVLVLTSVASALLLSPYGPQQLAFGTAASAAVFGANVHLYRHTGYFDSSAEMNPFLHTWSLSIEEQLYLVVPVLLVLLWSAGSRRGVGGRSWRPVVWGLGALGGISLAGSLALVSGAVTAGLEAPARLAFYAMPTRVWEFVAGMLLALGVVPEVAVRAASWLGGLGLTAVLVAAVVADPLAPHPGAWAVVVVLGTVALLAGGGRRSTVDRLLGARPLVRLGDVSYGWYLWHWPAIVFTSLLRPDDRVAVVAAAFAALVPAALSYRFVERPVVLGRSWRGARTGWLAAACVALPLLVLGALDRGAAGGWGVVEPLGWYDQPETRDSGCHVVNRDMPNDLDVEGCTFGPEGADRTVVVLGDEAADGIATAVIEAGRRHGWRTVQWSRAGCPALDGVVPVYYPRCTEWQDLALARVEELAPDAVVVAHRSSTYDRLVRRDGVGGDGDLWSLGLERLIGSLGRRGTPLLVVAQVPDYGARFPGSRISPLDPDPPVPTLTLDELEQQRGATLAQERRVVARHPGAELLDPVEVLCDDVCSPVQDGEWRYMGPFTLNATGARSLAGRVGAWFVEAIGD